MCGDGWWEDFGAVRIFSRSFEPVRSFRAVRSSDLTFEEERSLYRLRINRVKRSLRRRPDSIEVINQYDYEK